MTKSKTTTVENVPVVKSSVEIKVVDELGGYVTPKLAAQMLGLELASMSAIIHSGKVDSVKISGVVLIEKVSVEKFALVRETRRQEDEQRMLTKVDRKIAQNRAQQLKKLLETMSPEAIDALLVNGKVDN
jgi:hypothetical protein